MSTDGILSETVSSILLALVDFITKEASGTREVHLLQYGK